MECVATLGEIGAFYITRCGTSTLLVRAVVGNAKASDSGTSNGKTPHLFCVYSKANPVFNYSFGSGEG